MLQLVSFVDQLGSKGKILQTKSLKIVLAQPEDYACKVVVFSYHSFRLGLASIV
jgi:hypothetical protein